MDTAELYDNETGEEQVQEVPPTQEQPTEEVSTEQPEQKGEETPEPPAEPETPSEPETVPIAAIKDERQKRQQLEQQLAFMQQQMAAMQRPQQQPQQQPEEEIDFFDNPQAAVSKIVQQGLQSVNSQWENRFLDLSERAAASRYENFQEYRDEYLNAARQNPQLVQQALQQADPYDYIYNTVKAHKERQELGDPQKWKEQTREQIRAELMKEFETQKAQLVEQAIQGVLPSSMSAKRATGGGTGTPAWAGPPSAEKLFDE